MTPGPQVLGPPPGPTREVLGVTVVDGEVPVGWDAAVRTGSVWADPDRVLVWHDDAALYVANGSEIVLQTRSEQHRLDYDYLVYAAASRVLLRQRLRFCMHATMVVSPAGEAIAITGDSMAGKSTTTVELVRRGWRFACDDVLEVDLTDSGPMAVPFERPIHLSDSSARLLGADPRLGRGLPERDKRVFALDGDLTPRMLRGVVHLRVAAVDQVELTGRSSLAALPALAVQSDPMGTCQHPRYRSAFLRWSAGIANGAPLCDLARPASGASVTRVADVLEAWVQEVCAGPAAV